MAGRYSAIDAMCFVEFLSYYYTAPKSIKYIESDCQPIVLDDEIMGSNHVKRSYPKAISLMSSKGKLKCRNVKAVLRYHQPSPNRDIEKFAHHMLFSLYLFRIEEHLKLPPITGTYFKKLQEPGVLDVINRNRAIMKPFSDVIDEALLNLQSNLDAFSQQDENQEEITLIGNDLLNNENPSDGAVLLEDTLFKGSYSTPTLNPDDEFNYKIRSLNYEQRRLLTLFKAGRNVMLKANYFLC